jgi:hypothetical protein
MNREFRPNADVRPWGPFVSPNYVSQPITYTDFTVATVVWVLTLGNAALAVRSGFKQSRSSRSPLRSVYVWLIWLELGASFAMGLQCYLYLLKLIRPSMLHKLHMSVILRTDALLGFGFYFLICP